MTQRPWKIATAGRRSVLLAMLWSGFSTAADISVHLNGALPEGLVYRVALHDGAAADWSEPLRTLSGPADQLRFADVPPGTYALRLFGDLNGDGELALSPRGLPLEPVGFSNTPKALRAQPTPAQCAFDHEGQDSLVEVRLHRAGRRADAPQAASGG